MSEDIPPDAKSSPDQATDGAITEALGEADVGEASVSQFKLTVIEGPCKDRVWESIGDVATVGSHASNDLVLDDPTISRFHCDLRVDRRGVRIRDFDSKNGTILDGVPVLEAFMRGGSVFRLGRSAVRFDFAAQRNRLVLSNATRFGSLVGTSVPMRATFAVLERAAASNATVLIEGETGTGKEGAAASLWKAGPRKEGPFVVVDCSAIPENLLESELFGHERGSFTGAASRRIGAFEEANGGTIFLDEIGELSTDLQPKLLRALESREIRRVGSNAMESVDVRVIAATNRDLRADVNAGRFRSDLYFRLAVVRVPMPPLRSRPEDIPMLVDSILAAFGASPKAVEALRQPEFLATLRRAAWPGNIRELRNYLERCLVFEDPAPLGDYEPTALQSTVEFEGAYEEARRKALANFERGYVRSLLRRHGGKVALAADEAGIDRAYIYRLMRRYGITT